MKAELEIVKNDKVKINSIITAIAAMIALVLGLIWHPAFFLVSLFGAGVSVVALLVLANKIDQKKFLSDDDEAAPAAPVPEAS